MKQHGNASMDKNFFRKNLRLIEIETVLSSIGVGFGVSIITIFWNSIGMNQKDIGAVQMIFTICVLLFDIPMGYIADRFNRKALNIIGDIGTALTFLMYAFAQNMLMATISECLLGFFMATTNGVDQAFIKYNCEQIDPSGEMFKKHNVNVQIARYFALFLTTALGGLIAKISLRLAIAASFGPYLVSGILSFFIKDFDLKLEKKHNNPLKDMIFAIKQVLASKDTRVYLSVFVSANEITHSQIWVLTPLLLMVGVPVEIVSLGWVMNFFMQIIGGKIAQKMIHLDFKKMYSIPILLELTWMMIIIIHVNIVTVWLFALNGMVHGLLKANTMTKLQESASNDIQTSVMSVASTFCRIVYIPLVYFVNYLGNIKLTYALVGVLIIFVPFYICNMIALRKLEKDG